MEGCEVDTMQGRRGHLCQHTFLPPLLVASFILFLVSALTYRAEIIHHVYELHWQTQR